MRTYRLLFKSCLLAALVAGYSAMTPAVTAQFGGPQGGAPQMRPASGDAVTDALRDLNFRSIGPANMTGRVSAILGVPGDPRTF